MLEGYNITDDQQKALNGEGGPAEQSHAILGLASQMMQQESASMKIMGTKGTKVHGNGPFLVESPARTVTAAQGDDTVLVLINQGGAPALAEATLADVEEFDLFRLD